MFECDLCGELDCECNLIEEIDHELTDEIVCPFCGGEFSDSWEIMSDCEDLGLIECGECEKSFYATRNISISYSTEKATYGTCRHCKEQNIVVENYYSSIGRFEGLCIRCGESEKQRLREAYMQKIIG